MARQVASINFPSTLSLRGEGYVGGDFDALGANFAHVQLFNPAASGVEVIITRIAYTNSIAARNFLLKRFDTALTTLSTNVSNKRLGGIAPSAELRTETNVTQLGTTIIEIRAEVDQSFTVPVDPPFTLPEGTGILVTSGSLGDGVSAVYSWVEVAL